MKLVESASIASEQVEHMLERKFHKHDDLHNAWGFPCNVLPEKKQFFWNRGQESPKNSMWYAAKHWKFYDIKQQRPSGL